MVNSSKDNDVGSVIDETAEDAVEVTEEDLSNEADLTADETADHEDEVSDIPEDDATDTSDGENSQEDHVSEAAPVENTEPMSAPVAPPPTMTVQKSGPGFIPLALGGVVAGALGWGIATYGPQTDPSDAFTDQISALEDKIDSIPAPDLSSIETQMTDLSDRIASFTAETGEQLFGLEERLAIVERQPNADGTLSDTALSAYREELDGLRAELEEQRLAVMTAAEQAQADLTAARAESERLEQETLNATVAAANRAALNRIGTAVNTGEPFADALASLQVENMPPALSAAADSGVATNAQLVDDFSDAAGAALSTARSEGQSDDTTGFSGFLRSQFNVRSTTPQEGTGPDAVLSRAEAAIKDGRVSDALSELTGLPDVARAEMSDWTDRAQARSDVLDALSTLSETYQ